MESQVRGGTRWKRFAVVMVPSVVATAAVGIGLAQGALAASFSVSGQDFKVTADRLEGWGFAQYGGIDTGYSSTAGDEKEKTQHPVAISSFDRAEITKMCQSVKTKIPGIGTIYLRLDAGPNEKNKVEAKNLYIDVAQLEADATFTNIDIGVAVKDKTRGPAVKQGERTAGRLRPAGGEGRPHQRQADGVGDHGRDVQAQRSEDASGHGLQDGVLLTVSAPEASSAG